MTGDRLYKKYKRITYRRQHALRQQPKNVWEKIHLSLTPPAMAHKLYRLMQIAHEVFAELNITYWADGGTLLGAMRNGGIIATDDDLDVCIFKKDAHKLYGVVRKKLRERGCDILPIDPCEKIFFAEDITKIVDPKTGEVSYKPPSVGLDVLLVQEKASGICTYSNACANAAWSRTFFYPVPQLFPLRLVPFGPLMIWVPCDPHSYLDRGYPGWHKDAHISPHHRDIGIKGFTVLLNPELCKPAPWKAGFEYIKGQPASAPPVIDITKVGG